jgi:hypothetical protein
MVFFSFHLSAFTFADLLVLAQVESNQTAFRAWCNNHSRSKRDTLITVGNSVMAEERGELSLPKINTALLIGSAQTPKRAILNGWHQTAAGKLINSRPRVKRER